MKVLLKLVAGAVAMSATSPAVAATYIFQSNDWSQGATFNGRFTVRNVVELYKGSKWYSFDLVKFDAQFSGNAFVDKLTFGLRDVIHFDYAFDGEIGEDRLYDEEDWDEWGEYGEFDSLSLTSEFGSFYIGDGSCHLGVGCGQIVDFRRTADGESWQDGYDENSSALSVTAVPEPATWALLLLGFGAIGGVVRRKKTDLRVAYSF